MKKKYNAPTLDVIGLGASNVIVTSYTPGTETMDGGGSNAGEGKPHEAGAPHRGIWDEG